MADYVSKYTGEAIDNAVGLSGKTSQNLIFKYKDGSTQTFNGSTELEVDMESSGTEVIANPTLVGSETALEGIAISGTKYKTPNAITPITAPPELSYDEYSEHLLYLYEGGLNFLYENIDANAPIISALSSLPISMQWASAIQVGENVYIFGGATNQIIKYDLNTKSGSLLAATFPVKIREAAVCAVGNDIYIMGGYDLNTVTTYDTIYKFSTETESLEQLPEKLPRTLKGAWAVNVNEEYYIIGGSSTIYKFSPLDYSFTPISASLDSYDEGLSIVASGTDIYIIGGSRDTSHQSSNIRKLDTVTESLTTVGTLPVALTNTCSVIFDKYIYICGGYRFMLTSGQSTEAIYKFDIITKECVRASVNLPKSLSAACAVSQGQTGYIFGGGTDNAKWNSVYQIDLNMQYIQERILNTNESITYEEI